MIDQLSIAVNSTNSQQQQQQQGQQAQQQQQQQQQTQSVPSSNSSGRLLKHVVRCYMRLSDNLEARKALANILPEPLRDGTFSTILQDDLATKRCLSQLLSNINEPQ